jgi:hypothetical protein
MNQYFGIPLSLSSDSTFWCLSFFGTWTICCFIITQLELLNVFRVIAPLLTPTAIRNLQTCAIVIQCILHAPLYVMPPITSLESALLRSLIVNGAAVYAGLVSLLSILEVLYLVKCIYQHLMEKKSTKMELKVTQIVWFILSYVVMVGLDFVGIYLFLEPTRRHLAPFAPLILQIRVILIVYIFISLRNLTLADELKLRKKSHDAIAQVSPLVPIQNSEHTKYSLNG